MKQVPTDTAIVQKNDYRIQDMSGITIKNIETDDDRVIDAVVDIHLDTFKGFFLTFLGRGFLKYMYRSYVKHKNSDILVAICDDEVVGFLAYSENMSGLYQYMIKRYIVQFAWYSIGAFFRKPKVFLRLIRAFLKPSESKRTEKYIELSSIGVSPSIKNKGIGSMLINTLKERVDFNVFEYIKLETDALDNEYANNFYLRNGFSIVCEYETHEGRRMNEYRYGGEKNEKASLHTQYCQKS